MNLRVVVLAVVMAFSTPAMAGLASIPVGTAGFQIEGTVGGNTVTGTAVYQAGVVTYEGHVSENPIGERWLRITATASGTKTQETTSWVLSNVGVVVTVGGLDYVGDLKVGDLTSTTLEEVVVSLVELYSRGPSSKFTSTRGALPAISGLAGGPVNVSYTNSRGDRFAGTVSAAFDAGTLALSGTWTSTTRQLHVDASGYCEDWPEFVTQIVVETTRADGSVVDRVMPPTLRLHGATLDDTATKFVHFALVMSATPTP